jgi:3-dehydroquinate synthase
METRITVDAPGDAYPILIGAGILEQIAHRASEFGLTKRVAIITNTTLAPLYGDVLAARLPNAVVLAMPDGEVYKTLETLSDLYRQMINAGLDRGSTLIALGGGVVGDTAGFAAATYMRGIRLVQMPTSLLAMVDSSVGGKVGVDIPEGKNLVGAFKQPDMVLIDTDVLKTLPQREWQCGMAETIKHGFIADPALLQMASYSHKQEQPVDELVRRAVQVKVNIVQQDPYEQNIRAYLNLGHTFAHAIERVTHYQWLHGEAVGVGLVAAAHLSERIGLCKADIADEVEQLVKSIGLPTRTGNLDSEALYSAMSTDKKWLSGSSRFILLKDIGQPQIVEGVAKRDVIAVLEALR